MVQFVDALPGRTTARFFWVIEQYAGTAIWEFQSIRPSEAVSEISQKR
jgi:hypothetical protein